MPTYQYACTNPECLNRFELVQAFTDPAASECPVCGGAVRKVYGSVGVVFKGSGFYRNDSRSGANGSSGETAGKSDSAKSDSAKSDSAKSDAGSGKSESGSGSSDSRKSSDSSQAGSSSSGGSSAGNSSSSSSGSPSSSSSSGKAASPA